MKITYIKLENVVGIKTGLDRDTLEIDFSNAMNKITAIEGRNGCGKSVLISSLQPFAYVTALDDRSSLPYIIPKKNGYKEIHFVDGADEYIIKHFFKASKDTHVVKSYFMKNGTELNENGNVTSFNSLVSIHLGLTQEMMRLIRIGTNVNSFITLAPAKRKEYIGRLIDEIDLYIQIYKKITDDLKVVKALISTNNSNLYNCHISDIIVEREALTELAKQIDQYESEKEELSKKIGKLDALMKENDINELRKRVIETEASLNELKHVENEIMENGLGSASIDDLIKVRAQLNEQKLDAQSQINSLRMNIDSIHKTIERLETSIKRMTSNHDLKSLVSNIEELRDSVAHMNPMIINFKPKNTSDNLNELFAKLQSFNQIDKMILSLGNRPLDVYIKLKKNGIDIESWLKDQAKKKLSNINEYDVGRLVQTVFGDEDIIFPNCDEEYEDCPYYRLSEVISGIKDKMAEESYSDETLRYIQVINNNMEYIFAELERLKSVEVPDRIRDGFSEDVILERLGKHYSLFDLSSLQEYLTLTREHELYLDTKQRLESHESQLAIYKQSGISSYSEEIDRQKQLIEDYRASISSYNIKLNKIQGDLDNIESQIGLVTKFKDSAKYKTLLESTLTSTKRILGPLETSETERSELGFKLRQVNNTLNMIRERHKNQERKILEYERLVKEGERLQKMGRDMSIIQEAVSTKQGIPIYYMKKYLGNILKLSNDLLRLIYNDEFRLAPFVVTPESFEIPYVKNGRKIPDIKYASQSEIALATMALSFALAKQSTSNYNIICLDEIDAGLDTDNRNSFLKMLYNQMEQLQAEQVFVISHNLSQMANVPMDCIRLTPIAQKLRLQNIIYEE